MNDSLIVFLLSDKCRAINCSYEVKSNGKGLEPFYTFKSMDPNISVGDYVVVPTDTRHNMTICRVEEVDVEVNFDSTHDYKWIICPVLMAAHADVIQQEALAISKKHSAEKRRRRVELRKDLLADTDTELTSLPIYDHENGTTVEPAPQPAPDTPTTGKKE